MAKYINWKDAVIRYPSLSTVGGASEVGSTWIGHVEAQIEGMLSSSYTIPFSNNNETVKDLAVELLYIRVGNLKVKEAKSMREDFMSRIKNIKSGNESMITSSGKVVPMVGDTIYSSTSAYSPIFDLSSVENWGVDESQIEDIDNAKT